MGLVILKVCNREYKLRINAVWREIWETTFKIKVRILLRWKARQDMGLFWVIRARGWKEGLFPRGFFYQIYQLIWLPTRMANGELLHAVTMATVSKSGRAWEGSPQCEEMSVEGAGKEKSRCAPHDQSKDFPFFSNCINLSEITTNCSRFSKA